MDTISTLWMSLVDGLAHGWLQASWWQVLLTALAFTHITIAAVTIFGGFGHAFYTAYHSTWPLDPAAGTRNTLYNLYHVLNHFNLFGGGYLEQAQSMIDRLLAELGR